MIVKRGELYYADLSPVVGSELGGIRPVLVVQNDIGNKYFTQYKNGDSTQYIMKTNNTYRNWIVYTSIDKSIFKIDTTQYISEMMLFSFLFYYNYIIGYHSSFTFN